MTRKSYEISFRGDLPADLLPEIGEHEVVIQPSRTVLTGSVRDQAALHGLLLRMHRHGLELVEVRTTDPPAAPELHRSDRATAADDGSRQASSPQERVGASDDQP